MLLWGKLAVEYKEGYRIRLCLLAEEMDRIEFSLGIRLETGGKYGTVEDKTIRISPVIRHYDDLSSEEQKAVLINL